MLRKRPMASWLQPATDIMAMRSSRGPRVVLGWPVGRPMDIALSVYLIGLVDCEEHENFEASVGLNECDRASCKYKPGDYLSHCSRDLDRYGARLHHRLSDDQLASQL